MNFSLTKRSHILKQVLQGWLQGVVTAVVVLTALRVVLVVRAGGATHPSMSLDSRGHKPLTKLVWATSHVLRALINNLISFCVHRQTDAQIVHHCSASQLSNLHQVFEAARQLWMSSGSMLSPELARNAAYGHVVTVCNILTKMGCLKLLWSLIRNKPLYIMGRVSKQAAMVHRAKQPVYDTATLTSIKGPSLAAIVEVSIIDLDNYCLWQPFNSKSVK